MSDRAIVDISEVHQGTVRVTCAELRPGDEVFDTFGGTHKLTAVWRQGNTVQMRRDDGWRSSFAPDQTITIRR